MDIKRLIEELLLYPATLTMMFILGIIIWLIIISVVIWDCLIFIINRLGELLWQKKQ